MVIRVNPEKIDPYYVLMYLRTEEGYQSIQRCIRGQTAHIYPKDVKQIKIPLPPSDEIDAFEAISEAMKDSLKKRREYEKAYYSANSTFSVYMNPKQVVEDGLSKAESSKSKPA